jgi:hypothetical protein
LEDGIAKSNPTLWECPQQTWALPIWKALGKFDWEPKTWLDHKREEREGSYACFSRMEGILYLQYEIRSFPNERVGVRVLLFSRRDIRRYKTTPLRSFIVPLTQKD